MADLYPSTRYHPAKGQATVSSPEEEQALGEGWRDIPFSNAERLSLGFPALPRPVAPKRNDFKTVEEFQSARVEYEALSRDYEYSQLPV